MLASFHIVSAPNWNLPGDYVAELKNGTFLLSQNYTYSSSYFDGTKWIWNESSWVPKATSRTIRNILDKVADNIKP